MGLAWAVQKWCAKSGIHTVRSDFRKRMEEEKDRRVRRLILSLLQLSHISICSSGIFFYLLLLTANYCLLLLRRALGEVVWEKGRGIVQWEPRNLWWMRKGKKEEKEINIRASRGIGRGWDEMNWSPEGDEMEGDFGIANYAQVLNTLPTRYLVDMRAKWQCSAASAGGGRILFWATHFPKLGTDKRCCSSDS